VSFLVIFLAASIASAYNGRAAARSFSQSVLIALASSAAFYAMASSTATLAAIISAALASFST